MANRFFSVIVLAVAVLFTGSCGDGEAVTTSIEGRIADSVREVGIACSAPGNTGGDMMVLATSPVASDGSFRLVVTDSIPRGANLTFDGEAVTSVFTEGGKLTVLSDTLTRFRVCGSVSNDAHNRYMDSLSGVFALLNGENTDVDAFWERHQAVTNAFYQTDKGRNLMALNLLVNQFRFSMTPQEILDDLDAYDAFYRKSPEWVYLHDYATNILKTAVGMKAPEISLHDPSGQLLTLSKVAAAHRYTLVDFWASWCVPCMAELPDIKAAYAAFRDAGFTIFGVSLDDKRERWVKAIEDKGMDWFHVSALKKWECPAALAYGVGGVPANFLLDSRGVIVAKDLHGDSLRETLEHLFSAR